LRTRRGGAEGGRTVVFGYEVGVLGFPPLEFGFEGVVDHEVGDDAEDDGPMRREEEG
jgi:hypothetical protein